MFHESTTFHRKERSDKNLTLKYITFTWNQVCHRLYVSKKRILDPEVDSLVNPHEVSINPIYISSHLFQSSKIPCSKNLFYIFAGIFIKLQEFHVRKINPMYLLTPFSKFKNSMFEKSIPYICSHLFQSSKIPCSENKSYIFACVFLKVQKFHVGKIDPTYLLASFSKFKNFILGKWRLTAWPTLVRFHIEFRFQILYKTGKNSYQMSNKKFIARG